MENKKIYVAVYNYYSGTKMELEQAINNFLECMIMSEGSEQSRYATILGQLMIIKKTGKSPMGYKTYQNERLLAVSDKCY